MVLLKRVAQVDVFRATVGSATGSRGTYEIDVLYDIDSVAETENMPHSMYVTAGDVVQRPRGMGLLGAPQEHAASCGSLVPMLTRTAAALTNCMIYYLRFARARRAGHLCVAHTG